MSHLKETKEFEDLFQTNASLKTIVDDLKCSKETASQIWHTLVGIKLLTEFFQSERKMWKLVAMKARKALKERLGFPGDIDEVLSKMTV